ncbi:MAG: D-methionine transport system substrate-binding protein [Petroclostridium sp.]|jgi:D-methionine transport system substrate-binding protein|uniref:MetQ/NlpA family ABC transporter substrate-binding protein n=1 Tax=Petroclostridium xylanilyticum TaxID=1792311 RepID=UPI000B999179|nr:MetQ/NlpA family ABC transporter substrate-binding protein [Petroclostridium xylanilyticum]MBZ4646885.1 transporter substrate-binding protein [Clostridia bacterium]MDK2809588.1 D-methionine transport system substrate-binding protein [Petroclostridium sp.]
MKKINKFLSILIIFSIIVLAGCSATDSNVDSTNANKAEEKTTKLVVGATPVPHAEILNFVKPILKEKGIELEIKEFTDYTTPNIALNDKQLDANFFQHIPYMDDFAKEKNIKLVAAAKVHVEPMGVYSNKIKSIGELKNDASIAIPNDATNEGRALLLLQKQGLIKLKDEKNLTQTPKDIIENPKNLKFKELEAAQLPRVLQDVDIAVINTNYALEAKLNPTKDALFIEDKDSPYANILAVRPDNEKDPKIMELVKILNSDDVKKFINEKYSGAIVPAF